MKLATERTRSPAPNGAARREPAAFTRVDLLVLAGVCALLLFAFLLGTNATSGETLEWDKKGLRRNAGNVLRVDGSVQRHTSESLREALIHSGDSKNNYSQPGFGNF